MLAESLLLLVFLLLGYAVQLAGAPAGLRDVVWVLFFWTFSPVLVFVAFLTVDLDEGLGRALAAAILASWLVGLGGYGYARLVAGERDERGALTLAAGFGNTGFVGFPLAQLAYGADGSRSQRSTTGFRGSCRPRRSRRRSRVSTAAARSRSRGGTGCVRCSRTRLCTPSGSHSCCAPPASTSRALRPLRTLLAP